jgi:hypothetical protein
MVKSIAAAVHTVDPEIALAKPRGEAYARLTARQTLDTS